MCGLLRIYAWSIHVLLRVLFHSRRGGNRQHLTWSAGVRLGQSGHHSQATMIEMLSCACCKKLTSRARMVCSWRKFSMAMLKHACSAATLASEDVWTAEGRSSWRAFTAKLLSVRRIWSAQQRRRDPERRNCHLRAARRSGDMPSIARGIDGEPAPSART